MATSTMSKPTVNGARQADRVDQRAAHWLAEHSITALRVSLGVVFLAFGMLKFVPGASPAEDLAVRTLDTLSFGIVSGGPALVLTAVTETAIGLTLVTGRLLKVGLVVLGASLVGIVSPLVLFFGDLVMSGVTLEAQYVFKDIVLIAAAMVVTAQVLGARMVTDRATALGTTK